MTTDRNILTSALRVALPAWEEWKRARTLLTQYPPDQSILAALITAIASTKVFQPISGKSLFSANGGRVIDARLFATPLLYRADRTDLRDDAVTESVDWLIRVIETRHADGAYIGAIWGLKIDEPIAITKDIALLPFDHIPDGHMKGHVRDSARRLWDEAVWTSQRYFELPGSAIIRKVSDFPYIGSPKASFDRLAELEAEAEAQLFFLQTHIAVQPLAVGTWFEYDDRDLDINAHENYLSWFVPEITPRIHYHTHADADTIRRDIKLFSALPSDWRRDLLRSMQRFTLSQCRHQIVDKALDLAIAFETALSQKGDYAPPGWKVGVRSAQLIGGTLEKRKQNRRALDDLYQIRNAGTHGGNSRALERQKQEEILKQATSIYSALLTSFISLGQKPDWKSLDLEPRTRE